MAHVALLRGINVGGRNMLPMPKLVAMFEEAGCEAVRNYIQSGNIVFKCSPTDVKRRVSAVKKAIKQECGIEVPIVVRSAAELAAISVENPFLKEKKDADALHVMFLEDVPSAARVASLDPNRSPGDSFRVQGQEIFLHCPNGVGRTKLTNSYFDSKLQTVSTSRNWRTLAKLLEMTQG